MFSWNGFPLLDCVWFDFPFWGEVEEIKIKNIDPFAFCIAV